MAVFIFFVLMFCPAIKTKSRPEGAQIRVLLTPEESHPIGLSGQAILTLNAE